MLIPVIHAIHHCKSRVAQALISCLFASATGKSTARNADTDTASASVSPAPQPAPQASQRKALTAEKHHKSPNSAVKPPSEAHSAKISVPATGHQVKAAQVVRSDRSSKPTAGGGQASEAATQQRTGRLHTYKQQLAMKHADCQS